MQLLKNVLLLQILYLFILSPCAAQSVFSFDKETIEVTAGKIFRYEVKLSAKDSILTDLENYKVCFSASKDVRLLMPECFDNLNQNDDLIFSLKILLPKNMTQSAHKNKVHFRLINRKTEEVILINEFSIKLAYQTQINIQSKTSNIEISKGRKTIPLSFQINNKGSKEEKISIDFIKLPQGIKSKKKVIKLKLPPYSDSLYHIDIESVSNNNTLIDSDVIIVFSYGKQQKIVEISAVKKVSKNKYQTKNYNNSHYLHLRYETSHILGTRIITEAKGKIKSDKGAVSSWQSRFNYFGRSKRLQFFNTSYERKTEESHLKVGNISLRNEAGMFGRGINLKIGRKENHTQFTYVNGQTDLSHKSFSNQTQRGNSVLLGHTFHTKNNNSYNIYGLHQRRLSGQTLLTGFSSMLKDKRGGTFKYSLNISSEKQELNPTIQKVHYGLSSKLNWIKAVNKWKFSSQNYFATPWYSGLRRGDMIFNEKAEYSISKKLSISGAVNLQKRLPQSAEVSVNRRSTFSSPQLLVNYKHDARLRFTFGAFSLFQSANYINHENPNLTYKSRSQHIQGSIQWFEKENYLQISANVGLINSSSFELNKDSKMILGSRLNYRYKNLGVTAVYQKGGQYLFEMYRDARATQTREFVSINPEATFPLIKNKLDLNLFGLLTHDNERKTWVKTYSSQLLWKISPDFNAMGELRYLHSGYFSNINLILAIKKNFKFAPLLKGHFDLKLNLFSDKNTNGLRDIGELAASNLLVRIGEVSLVSDELGQVSCKNFPPGFYDILITDTQNGATPIRHEIHLSKNIDQDIPIYARTILRGNVNLETAKFGLKKVDLQSLFVVAKGDNDLNVRAFVRHNGDYSLHLPAGNYLLYLDGPAVNKEIEVNNNHRRIQIFSDQISIENFSLNIKERKVNLKRF